MEDILLDCPTCNNKSLEINQLVNDIPYFGPIQIISSRCRKCGVKTTDFFIIEDQPPRRFTLKVEKERQLRCRVVRSSSGTIRIPELKFILEPGNSASGFITNVEGVLLQVASTIETLKQWNPNKGDELGRLSEKVEKGLKGQLQFTIVVEDPTGNSGIVPISEHDALVIDSL